MAPLGEWLKPLVLHSFQHWSFCDSYWIWNQTMSQNVFPYALISGPSLDVPLEPSMARADSVYCDGRDTSVCATRVGIQDTQNRLWEMTKARECRSKGKTLLKSSTMDTCTMISCNWRVTVTALVRTPWDIRRMFSFWTADVSMLLSAPSMKW